MKILGIIVIVLLKLCTVGTYGFDYIQTKKLIDKDHTIVRELTALQKVEVFLINALVIACIFFPITRIKMSYSIILHLVTFIIEYNHINRWIFVGKKYVIYRTKAIQTNRLIRPELKGHTLYIDHTKIRFPLCKKERLQKYLRV